MSKALSVNRPGKRFPLLFYRRMFGLYRWPAFLLMAASFVLWWYARVIPFIGAEREDLVMAIVILSGLLFIASLIATNAYVQCRPEHLRIQTPLLRLVISYGRIRDVRPVNFSQLFPPEKQKRGDRLFLQPFQGQTAVGINLNGYPLSEQLLRLFLNRYMFPPDQTGLIFVVGKDWMSLSTQLSSYRDRWLAARAEAQRPKQPRISPFHQ